MSGVVPLLTILGIEDVTVGEMDLMDLALVAEIESDPQLRQRLAGILTDSVGEFFVRRGVTSVATGS